jgi:ribosomal protein S18 acetylase RimI-like enzyme
VPGFEIARMQRSEEAAVIATLARAFHDDPLFNFLVPDLLSQGRANLTFMHSLVADARGFGEIWVARVGAKIAGAAVWLPPGAYPRGAWRETLGVLRDLRSVPRLGSRLFVSIRLQNEIQRAHHRMKEPHWYLSLLGADPMFQRSGAGTALLAPILERSDAEGMPVYLETQKEENLPWYHRFGFEVVEELRVTGSPSMWAMRRR